MTRAAFDSLGGGLNTLLFVKRWSVGSAERFLGAGYEAVPSYDRALSTINHEVRRKDGVANYRATASDQAA